jgi:hypothetical protein
LRLTYTGTCTGGTWSYNSATGNITDGAKTGDPNGTNFNQPLFSASGQAITNNCGGGGGGPTQFLTQADEHFFLLRKVGGSLVCIPADCGHVNISLPQGAAFIVGVQVDETSGKVDPEAFGAVLEYDINQSGTFNLVTDTCGDLCFYGTADTDPSIPSGVPPCPLTGAMTCVDGGTQRTAAAVPFIDLAALRSTVNHYVVKLGTIGVGNQIRFRLRNQNGELLNAYTHQPIVTVVGGVASAGY